MISEQEEQLSVEQSTLKPSQHLSNADQSKRKLMKASTLILCLIVVFFIALRQYQSISQPQGSKAISEVTANEQTAYNQILSNPYNDYEHANISQQQISQAKTWRNMLYHDNTIIQQLTAQESQYYNSKYKIDLYPELPFCLIVPTYNNKFKNRHFRNIKSIISQQYTHFKFIIIDDASQDGTFNDLQSYLARVKFPNISYRMMGNTKRKYSLANIRWAAQSFCLPDQIMMVVDGDDQLIGRQVLKVFNAVFQEKKVWVAYSNYAASDGALGYSRPYHPDIIRGNSYRRHQFTMSHLRAYYTKLFLLVKEEDLKDASGELFTAAGDMAACIPILQQAHQRVAYIAEITYFYNINTGLNVHKDRRSQQRSNNLLIRTKAPYSPLTTLFL